MAEVGVLEVVGSAAQARSKQLFSSLNFGQGDKNAPLKPARLHI